MTVHTDELYQQVILEHNRKPRNYVELEHPSHAAEGYNPLCGDHLKVYLKVNGEKVIEDMAFMGDGCAISKASASMMTAALKGKTIADARSLFEEFQKLVKKELDPEKDPHHLGKLTVFSGIWKYPARVKCATLAWHTMKGALENSKVVSTE
jgi:nitrogen fixation NifU-like protein